MLRLILALLVLIVAAVPVAGTRAEIGRAHV